MNSFKTIVDIMTSPTNPAHKMCCSQGPSFGTVGHLSASLYPKIKPSMPVFERAHAFQVAKSTLKSLPANMHLLLNTMGN